MNSDIVVFSIIASGALLLCLSLFFSRNQKKGKAHKHHFEKQGGKNQEMSSVWNFVQTNLSWTILGQHLKTLC